MSDILARQRQLIGSTDVWAANDIVIGDGELALERTDAGQLRMKVGNGTDVFSDLPYISLGGNFGPEYKWGLPSRANATPYDAPADAPIMVNIIAGSSGANDADATIYIGATPGAAPSLTLAQGSNGGNGAMEYTLSAIIPPGYKYQVNWTSACATLQWAELRSDYP